MKKPTPEPKKKRSAMSMAEIYAEEYRDANWCRALFPINAASKFKMAVDEGRTGK